MLEGIHVTMKCIGCSGTGWVGRLGAKLCRYDHHCMYAILHNEFHIVLSHKSDHIAKVFNGIFCPTFKNNWEMKENYIGCGESINSLIKGSVKSNSQAYTWETCSVICYFDKCTCPSRAAGEWPNELLQSIQCNAVSFDVPTTGNI